MRAYLIRRILLLIPTLFIVTVVVFWGIRLMPGDYVDAVVARKSIELGSQAGKDITVDREAVEHAMGLDVPTHIQYLRWVGILPGPQVNTGEIRYNGLLQGNLGTSLVSGKSMTPEMIRRIPASAELNLLALIMTWTIALPVGIYSAIRQNTWFDYFGRSFAILSLATPAFWLASMVIVFGGRYFSWAPQIEYVRFFEDPAENLKMFLLPAFLTGTAGSGGLMRTLRTITLEVVRQDYIRTAWSKGLRERIIIFKHALRNAMIPLLEILVPMLGFFVGGSVIMEEIFAIPGLGRYLLGMIQQRDYFVASGSNLFYAVFGMTLILLADISYAWADPRIRYR
jgi:peptide/nickel transport system permease protein